MLAIDNYACGRMPDFFYIFCHRSFYIPSNDLKGGVCMSLFYVAVALGFVLAIVDKIDTKERVKDDEQ